jgi:hypothetical protein
MRNSGWDVAVRTFLVGDSHNKVFTSKLRYVSGYQFCAIDAFAYFAFIMAVTYHNQNTFDPKSVSTEFEQLEPFLVLRSSEATVTQFKKKVTEDLPDLQRTVPAPVKKLLMDKGEFHDLFSLLRIHIESINDLPGIQRFPELPEDKIKVATEPLKVFISYSHKDEKMRLELIGHLASLMNSGLISIWHDREIEAGGDWEGDINKEIDEADIILLLVSSSFLSSRYCQKELLRALDQRTAGKLLPIPIILRDCDWISTFNNEKHKMQALPRDNRSVAGGRWANHDAAYSEIAKELRKVIERMRS